MSDNVIKPNEMQQKAIDILKGQVMLLAGPGTGKTFTVIHRIEKMLSDGINPSSILCLTYSDAAANEMRQRLIKKMGVVASSVDIYTYHSFCNDIIKNYPSQFDLSTGVRVITDTEKITLMKECIDETPLKFFVPQRADRYYYTKNFINHVEELKTKRISKEDYMECIQTNPNFVPKLKELEAEIHEREQQGKTQNKTRYQELERIKKNIEKAKELWLLYEAYSNKMLNNNLIDFSDMINFVLNEFDKDITFAQDVSNKYQYFLVDEYQDTNQLQNAIIFNLVDNNKEKNVFVVGDDDQIIYGFQGARIDTIENFLTKYPETQVICLQENNRSTQSILDFSYAVISQDEKRLENNKTFKDKHISKKLTAKNPKITPLDKKIRLLHFGEAIQETNHIVDEIKALIDSPNCPKNDNGEKDLSKISIISKKRAELQMYAEMLKGKNIPIQIDEGKSIEDKLKIAIECGNFLKKQSIKPKIAVLASGRKGDYGRSEEISKSIDESEELTRLIKKNTDFEVTNHYILIEKALKDKCNVIIAPNGIIGNIIFRTLVLVNSWPSCGAITFGINSIYIDTSRDQNIKGYLRSLKLAYKLAKI